VHDFVLVNEFARLSFALPIKRNGTPAFAQPRETKTDDETARRLQDCRDQFQAAPRCEAIARDLEAQVEGDYFKADLVGQFFDRAKATALSEKCLPSHSARR
jgi:hypothetical protein